MPKVSNARENIQRTFCGFSTRKARHDLGRYPHAQRCRNPARHLPVAVRGHHRRTGERGDRRGLRLDGCHPRNCRRRRRYGRQGKRWPELQAGAQAARKPWLLFLKAGSSMEPGWEDEARAFIAKGGLAQRPSASASRARAWGQGCARRLPPSPRTLSGLPNSCDGLLIPAKLLDTLGARATQPVEEADLDPQARPEPRLPAQGRRDRPSRARVTALRRPA